MTLALALLAGIFLGFKLLEFLDQRYQARDEPGPERAPACGFVLPEREEEDWDEDWETRKGK